MHITGKAIPMKKTIQVLFVDDDTGAIVAHTCSNQMFPSLVSRYRGGISEFCIGVESSDSITFVL